MDCRKRVMHESDWIELDRQKRQKWNEADPATELYRGSSIADILCLLKGSLEVPQTVVDIHCHNGVIKSDSMEVKVEAVSPVAYAATALPAKPAVLHVANPTNPTPPQTDQSLFAAKDKLLQIFEFSDFRNYTDELHAGLVKCGYWDYLWKKVDVPHLGMDRIQMLQTLLPAHEYESLTVCSAHKAFILVDGIRSLMQIYSEAATSSPTKRPSILKIATQVCSGQKMLNRKYLLRQFRDLIISSNGKFAAVMNKVFN